MQMISTIVRRNSAPRGEKFQKKFIDSIVTGFAYHKRKRKETGQVDKRK